MENELTQDADFIPRWNGCLGRFNAAEGMSGEQNEQWHYYKHVKLGQEWGYEMTLAEYREKAKEHMNSNDSAFFLEFCQVEDLGVVKYNLDTGELGLARRDDGLIMTFFCPNDLAYIARKLENGLWGDPEIKDGWIEHVINTQFDDDEEKEYLYKRLAEIILVLPLRADQLFITFCEGEIDSDFLRDLLSDLGECRFLVHELYQRVMSADQEDIVHQLRKKIVRAEAVLETMEKSDLSFVNEVLVEAVDEIVALEEKFWRKNDGITNSDDLDVSLHRKDRLGYLLKEIWILQMSYRLMEVNLQKINYRLRRNDLYCRRQLGQLVRKIGFQNTIKVAPEEFFWRRIN
jgi:hypothetical protein